MISRRLLRIKILQVLYAHFNSDGPGVEKSEKDLEFSIKKGYDLYFYLLLLMVSIKRYAETRIELALNKKLPTHEDLHPNPRFIENEAIRQLEENTAFSRYINKHRINWSDHPELIKNLYFKLIESPYYKEYMERATSGYEEDKQVLIDFYSSELEDDEMFNDILEEKSIFWNDDIDFMVSMVVKTLNEFRPGKTGILPLYRSDDDRDFAFTLLRETIAHDDQYHKMIDDYVENWDIERIALIDNLIMQMTINELVLFPSIPVKVTFDEYIELAKYYSTPKSSVFINGLVDKIAIDLTEKGIISKTGRGLITE